MSEAKKEPAKKQILKSKNDQITFHSDGTIVIEAPQINIKNS